MGQSLPIGRFHASISRLRVVPHKLIHYTR